MHDYAFSRSKPIQICEFICYKIRNSLISKLSFGDINMEYVLGHAI